MVRRSVLPALFLVVSVAAGCTSEVVSGRAAQTPSGSSSGTSSSSAVRSGAAAFLDDAAARDILDDTRDGVVAVNSYDYRNLAGSRTEALRHVTGALTTEYSKTFDTVVAKNAATQQVRVSATAKELGLATREANTARVLVFGATEASAKTYSGLRTTPFALVVTVERTNGDWLLSKIETNGTIYNSLVKGAPGNSALSAATAAARAVATATTSLRRATFATDYDQLLAQTTGSLRTSLQSARASTQQALSTSGDLSGFVRAAGVASANGTIVEVLVSVQTSRVKAGRSATPTTLRLKLDVTLVDRTWRASALEQVS